MFKELTAGALIGTSLAAGLGVIHEYSVYCKAKACVQDIGAIHMDEAELSTSSTAVSTGTRR